MSEKKTRTETDTFGPIEVASDRYWGAQAERSLGNFKIGWEKQPASIVRALGIVKRAAAETNMEMGRLDPTLGKVIVQAAQPPLLQFHHVLRKQPQQFGGPLPVQKLYTRHAWVDYLRVLQNPSSPQVP